MRVILLYGGYDYIRSDNRRDKNVGLNKTEKAVLGLLIENTNRKASEMSSEVGVTTRTIERALVSLQKKGKIERMGSRRDGVWRVIK